MGVYPCSGVLGGSSRRASRPPGHSPQFTCRLMKLWVVRRSMPSPFSLRARMLMPALTTLLPAIPARSSANMQASIDLRVLNCPNSPLVHFRPTSPEPLHLSQISNHPSGDIKIIRPLIGEREVVIPQQVTLPACLLPPYPTTRQDLEAMAAEFYRTQISKWLPEDLQPLDFEEWVLRYPLKRREQLRCARARAIDETPTPLMARVKNFLKYECSTTLTDPRNISPRSDEFLTVVGPYISVMEHHLARVPWLVKGLTPDARSKKLDPLREFYGFIETDYSRFDRSISYEIITCVEQTLLFMAFPTHLHPLFAELMKFALITSANNEFDIPYRVFGTRCSGDAHTSIGNGLLNRFNTWMRLRSLPTGSWMSVHEGDDGVVCFDKNHLDVGDTLLSIISTFGFSVKTARYLDPSEVTFCGRWWYVDDFGLREMADLCRALPKFNVTLRPGSLPMLLYAKAMSYAYTDGSTPVLGVLCQKIISILAPRLSRSALKRAKWLSYQDRFLLRDVTTLTIDFKSPSPQSRACFSHRTGILPDRQILIEEIIMSWTDIPDSMTPLDFGLALFEEDNKIVTMPDMSNIYLMV